jgi:hypothetical protein
MKSMKDGKYKLPGAHKHERTLNRTTPNRLEASFKSNKCESMDEDASSALEMNVTAFSVKCSSLTPQSFSYPISSSNHSRISSWKDWGSVVSVHGGILCVEVSRK